MPTKTFLKIYVLSLYVLSLYYSFFFYSFGIEITNTSIHSCSSPKTRPDSRPKRHKTIPLAHSYMAQMREDSPHSLGLKATWKWPIHKALLMRLGQTLYLQNHFSRNSILLPMKVFLSLILPFLKEKKNLFYNGQFCLSQWKANIFSLKIPR